jgi:hypothetical protein
MSSEKKKEAEKCAHICREITEIPRRVGILRNKNKLPGEMSPIHRFAN